MEVLLYFLILQAITKCIAYDLEIEGVMRVGDEFLKKLNEDLYESRKVVQTTPRPVKPIRPFEIYTGGEKNPQKRSRKTGENDKSNRTYMNLVTLSFNRMKTDGLARLNKLQVVINNNLKVKKNMTGAISKASNEFSTTLDKYFEAITDPVCNTDLDVEFLLFDLVESSNNLLYSLQRRIFNDVVDTNKAKILKPEIKKCTERMFKQSVNDKKRQMELICEDHGACRPFPGFVDYFADLIGEMLKLSDDRLRIFLKYFNKAVKKNIIYINEIINERLLEKMQYHFSKLSVDMGIIRDIIAILRTVMTQRHKVINANYDKLKNRTAAVKILFDILDKSFENDGEDMVAMNIDLVVEAIRHWTTRAQEIESVVLNFVKYIVTMMKQSISDDTKKEINILSEVLLTGNTKINSVSEYLFTKGSKFVRGEDLYAFNNFLV